MDLKSELERRANLFNVELRNFLIDSKPKVLYDAARHLPMAGGKRLRPCISMLAGEAVSGDSKKVMPFAIAIELIHNFTLVHDDIMDKSHLRRNLPTVHIKFGEPTAIMAGDLLFAKAFESIHNMEDIYVFRKLDYGLVKCVEEICEGQQLDMEFEKRDIVSEKEYLEMIMKKTAFLFMFAAEGGAIAADGTKEEVNALKEYGKFLGLAFQIWDDYLDISSREETLGKDIGNDIRNGKKTLIAVYTLNNVSGGDKKLLGNIFGNKDASEEEVRMVFDLFKKTKSIDYARETAVEYCNKAKEALGVLKESDA
ncbi:MAG: polyprenyl synthetase family protein, partial [Candidatus Thermoplasmatota archaeon]|nr:polyprenyl synthetase family protein [Candidatus Thermoplasmatota archaeon]